MADDNKLLQVLTVISLVGSLYLIYRGLQGTSGGARTAAPGLSPSAVKSTKVTVCNLQPEANAALVATTCAIPLASDHLCCGCQGLHNCTIRSTATLPNRLNLQDPIIAGVFEEPLSPCDCKVNATVTPIPVASPFRIPQPRVNTNISECL
jgi:hypothetical protein